MNPDHSAQYTVQLKDSGVSMRTPHFITKIHRYESQARLEGWGEKTEIPWWLNGKESACQCRRHRFNPWVRKIPWRRKWQPTPVFLLGNSPEQRSQGGYSLWGHKRIGHGLATKEQQKLSTVEMYCLKRCPTRYSSISEPRDHGVNTWLVCVTR